MPDARLTSQSGLAKSPCRGFATRILAGVGLRRRRLFYGFTLRDRLRDYAEPATCTVFAGRLDRNRGETRASLIAAR